MSDMTNEQKRVTLMLDQQTLTRPETLLELRCIREFLKDNPLPRTESAGVMRRLLAAEERRLRAPIVFKWHGAHKYEIGHEGETRFFECELNGLSAAWFAFDDKGHTQTIRATDFAAPWARRADGIASRGIKVTAANWVVRETGLVELAELMRHRIHVPRNGVVCFMPEPLDPVVLTK